MGIVIKKLKSEETIYNQHEGWSFELSYYEKNDYVVTFSKGGYKSREEAKAHMAVWKQELLAYWPERWED